MLTGRGLSDELITRPEESYRLWCVVVCDQKNLKNVVAMARVGPQRHREQNQTNILQKLVGRKDRVLSSYISFSVS